MKVLSQETLSWLEQQFPAYVKDLKELAQIPAPSHQEERRAAWVKDWLQAHGAQGVLIDEAKNVIFPYGDDGKGPLTVFNAHTDVVFPDLDALPLRQEGDILYGPGVGDDTANVIALLQMVQLCLEKKLQPKEGGILFVFNSCEEGLGNLKGSRQLMKDYGARIRAWFAIDGGQDSFTNKAVGSKRYRISIGTEGGHSYGAFGNRNAIVYMAQLIQTFYSLKVPDYGRTTYNVGTIEGGTSVNTIAQQCSILFEYRSDDKRGLDYMDRWFSAIMESYKTMGIQLEVELVGDRPCQSPDVDLSALSQQLCQAAALHGVEMRGFSGSTDCNIPLSQGIPALCFGVYKGHGAHTREEWLDLSTVPLGMKILAQLLLDYMN